MSSHYIKSSDIDKSPLSDSSAKVIDLSVGIFFDGTNNNNVQAMMGQYYRRKEVYEKNKKALAKKGYKSFESVLKAPRSAVEETGVLEKAELDMIYGSAKSVDHTLDKTTLETNEYRWSSVMDDNAMDSDDEFLEKFGKGQIRNKLEKMAGNDDAGRSWIPDFATSFLAFSQGSNYTNPAILNSVYKVSSDDSEEVVNGRHVKRYALYIEGSGADTVMTVAGRKQTVVDDVIGLGFGVGSTGVVAKCKRVAARLKTICEKYQSDNSVKEIFLHLDIYGFSRGATSARLFTYLFNPKGTDNPNSPSKVDYQMLTGSESTYLPMRRESSTSKIVEKEVRTLGIYDTVSSVGVLRDPLNEFIAGKVKKIKDADEFVKWGKNMYHDCNVDDFGLFATDQAAAVLHICGLDENRINFALVDIESSIHSNGTEIFMPGCHTDIGGGTKLGLDDIKILNKNTIINKGAIVTDLYEKAQTIKGAIDDVKSTMSAAKQTIAGVKAVVEGVSSSTTGMGAMIGVPKALSGAVATYNGAKEAVCSSNCAMHKIKDALIETNEEAEQAIEKAEAEEQEAAKKEREGTTFLKQLAEDFIGTGNDAKSLAENVKSTIESGKKVAEDINKIKSADLHSADGIANTVNSIGTLLTDSSATLGSLTDTIRDISKMVGDIKVIVERIRERQRTRNPNLTLMDDISDVVKDVLDDMKQTLDTALDTCQCAKEIITGKKKPLLMEFDEKRVMFYNYYPCANEVGKPSNLLPVQVSSMQAMGWIASGVKGAEKTKFIGRAQKESLEKGETIVIDGTRLWGVADRENIGIYKYAAPGYSNLALKLMYEWSMKKADGIFDKYPGAQFGIPDDLQDFYGRLKSKISGNGRHFCTPRYEKDYRKLRCKYLHFSMNQQFLSLADNGLVNGPTFAVIGKDAVISRRIYVGKKDDETAGKGGGKPSAVKYLFEYANVGERYSCFECNDYQL